MRLFDRFKTQLGFAPITPPVLPEEQKLEAVRQISEGVGQVFPATTELWPEVSQPKKTGIFDMYMQPPFTIDRPIQPLTPTGMAVGGTMDKVLAASMGDKALIAGAILGTVAGAEHFIRTKGPQAIGGLIEETKAKMPGFIEAVTTLPTQLKQQVMQRFMPTDVGKPTPPFPAETPKETKPLDFPAEIPEKPKKMVFPGRPNVLGRDVFRVPEGVTTTPPFVEPRKVSGLEKEGKKVGIGEELVPPRIKPDWMMKAEKPTPGFGSTKAPKELGSSYAELNKVSSSEDITIYRASIKGGKIGEGDFVTTDRELAKFYARDIVGQRGEKEAKIVTQKVKAGDIRLQKSQEVIGVDNAFIYKPTEAPPSPGEAGFISTDYIKSAQQSFIRGGGVDMDVWEQNRWRQGNIKADIFNSSERLKELKGAIANEPTGVQENITQYLQGETTLAPDHLKPLLDAARQDIDALSQRFIASGIPKETTQTVIQKNLGKYMVRAYKAFETKSFEPSTEVKQRAVTKLRELHPRSMGKLSDEEMLNVVDSMLGKKEYTLYRGGKKAITIPQAHLKHRKDIPKEIRELYGEVRDPTWLYAKTVSELTQLTSNAEFFADVAKIPNIASKYKSGTNTVALPDTPGYGDLKGKFVEPELAEFLQSITNPTGFTLFDKFVVAPFKWTKTIGNIPTHPRNFMGNLIFSIMKGTTPLNPADVPYFGEAVGIIREKIAADTSGRPMAKEARTVWEQLLRSDSIETEFYGGEISKVLTQTLDDLEQSGISALGQGLWNIAKKPVDFLGQLYNAEDQIFKIASYLKDTKKLGLSPEEASRNIDAHFPNYRDVPKVTKLLRKVPIFGRFVSFKSESIRIFTNYLSEGIKQMKQGKPPTKLVILGLILNMNRVVRKAMAELHHIDLNKVKKVEEQYPIYRKYAQPIYYRNKQGEVKYFDLGYILPLGEHEQWFKASAKGDTTWMVNSMFGSPEFDMVTMLKTGEVPYTGKSIKDELGDISLKKAGAEFGKQVFTPSLHGIRSMREAGVFGKEHKAVDRWGRSRDAVEEIRAFFTGIRTGKIHPEIIQQNAMNRLKGNMMRVSTDFRNWQQRHPNASDASIQERTNLFERQMENIANEAEKIGGMLD